MLYILILILLVAWALGVFAFSLTGLIHILLVVAVIVLIIKLIRGEKIL